VSALVELPDGKVLSGSESGLLLLWDAAAIKAVILRPGGAACHAGAVEALAHDEATNLIVSGGADGVMRLWDMAHLDVEPPDAAGGGGGGSGGVSFSVEVKPSAEVQLPPGTRIRCVVWADRRSWLVTDDAGSIMRVAVPVNMLDAPAYSASRTFACHSGCVAGLATLPDCHVAVTAGADGSVRALDYTSGKILQSRSFSAPATCLMQLATVDSSAACRVVVGFGDGAVRQLQRCSDGWLLIAAQRPHRAAVVAIALSTTETGYAATVAADGTVFLFNISPQQQRQQQQKQQGSWQPLGFFQLPKEVGTPTCADWRPSGQHLLIGSTSGMVLELTAPICDVDNSK